MTHPNSAAMDWTDLILSPTGPKQASLSHALLNKLLESGHVCAEDLMKPGPGLALDNLPYEWLSDDQRFRRGYKRVVLPVWAHWLFCRSETEAEKATLFLSDLLPAHLWLEPTFNEFSALDWVAAQDDHNSMNKILGKVGRDALKAKQAQAASMGTASLHGQCSPEMARVLVKYGWDVMQQDGRGNSAIQTTIDARLFVTLLELGADPELARPHVSKVAERGQERQSIIKLINEKSAAHKKTSVSGGNALHDEVARILESGVSSGFATKLAKLAKEFPEGSPDGLLVGGRTPGAAMLDLASHMCHGDRLTVKAKTFLALGEALLQEDGKGWIKLDQPVRGAPHLEGMTDRQALVLGAIMLLSKANDQSQGGLSQCQIPRLMEGALIDGFSWISPLLAHVETLAPNAVDLCTILDQLSAPRKSNPTALDKAASRWWDTLDCANPVMAELLTRDWIPEDPTFSVEHLSGYERENWPQWLVTKTTQLYEHGTLDEAWIKACAIQWRHQAAGFLSDYYRDTVEVTIFTALNWVVEQDTLIIDLPQWKQFAHDIFGVEVPLSKIPSRFRTSEEDTQVMEIEEKDLPVVVMGEAVNQKRWELDGQDRDEGQAAILRRLPLQLMAMGQSPERSKTKSRPPRL